MALVLPVDSALSEAPTQASTESSTRSLFVRSALLLRSSRRLLQGKTDNIVVELDRRVYFVSWGLLFAARAICIAYCIAAASALIVLDHPYMAYYAELLRPGIRSMLKPTAVLYALVAVAHTIKMARMITAAFRRQETLKPTTSTSSKRWSCHAVIDSIWRPLFSRRGFFGVESRYYEARYAVRETIEIVSQSIQAYTSSVLIGQPWINNVYIAIVLINCTSTMIIHRITSMRKWSLAKERLACVVVDTILDAGTAIILPVILVYPYVRAIDLDFYSFDIERVYDDVWFIALINENRQIFPLSLVDLGFKFFPQVSLFMSIGSIASILQPRRRPVKEPPASRLYKLVVKSRALPRREPSASHASSRLAKFHAALLVWGLALLLCHIVAISLPHINRHEMDGCKQQLRPWFVAKSACTVYEFNCLRRDTDTIDDASDTGPEALSFLDAKSLAVLIVSHCSALRIPPILSKFPNLIGFEIYNSTLVQWDDDAALTSTTHPTITYVFIIRTNLTGIPPGLLHADLPRTLMDIEISTTNLSSVPPELHVTWRNVFTLYIEYSQLRVFPETLLKMELDDFSLIGNGITQLPDFATTSRNYFMLALAGNPITALPPTGDPLSSAGFLNLADTAISTLPDWIVTPEGSSPRVFLAGTPFCTAKPAAEIEEHFGFDARVSCTFSDRRLRSRYPLQITTRFFLS